MLSFILSLVFLFALALPISATETEAPVDGIIIDVDPAETDDSTDPQDSQAAAPDLLADPEGSEDAIVLALSGGLAGGYYFTADCALGSGLTFYVPFEWAYDVFTLDSSGAPVNLSNNTCYAYCPDYPDYTFSCSRFGTFVYRATNYNTTDLVITNITDTNMSFMEGNGVGLSDQEAQLLTNVLIFIVAAILIFKKG